MSPAQARLHCLIKERKINLEVVLQQQGVYNSNQCFQ